jgi:hypothetical protein
LRSDGTLPFGRCFMHTAQAAAFRMFPRFCSLGILGSSAVEPVVTEMAGFAGSVCACREAGSRFQLLSGKHLPSHDVIIEELCGVLDLRKRQDASRLPKKKSA